MTVEKIPDELKALNQWIVWRYVQRKNEKKPTKPPYSAKTLRRCDVTDPSSWCSFEEALAAYRKHKFDGIGFALANGYCGADLDACVNAETLAIEPHAGAVIDKLKSYSEFSPSITGLHSLVKATLKGAGLAPTINGKKYELFGSSVKGIPNKYFTVTGNHIPGTPLEVCERQEAFDELYDWVKEQSTNQKQTSSKKKGKASSSSITLADEELLALARNAKNGAKFEKLWRGDSSEYGDNVSDADQAFVNLLCFWSQDDAQVERLWKSSERYRGKLERDDYITRTIAKARAYQTASYTGELQSADEEQDISDLEEINGDDFPIVDDPKREKLLRLFACNAAKVMEVFIILLKLLGFKKNHIRLLLALTAVGRDRLGTFVAAQSWLKERYQEQGEHSSEATVQRDIRKLLEEQAELGVRLISYTPGSMNAKGERFASQFKNHLLRYALQAISISLDIRKNHKHTSAALEAACREVIASIPREEPTTFKGQVKRLRVKTISELETKRYQYENAIIEQMLVDGLSESEIDAEFEKRERDRKRRVSEAFRIRIQRNSKSA